MLNPRYKVCNQNTDYKSSLRLLYVSKCLSRVYFSKGIYKETLKQTVNTRDVQILLMKIMIDHNDKWQNKMPYVLVSLYCIKGPIITNTPRYRTHIHIGTQFDIQKIRFSWIDKITWIPIPIWCLNKIMSPMLWQSNLSAKTFLFRIERVN